ncbi:hypothetical protein [uncultured Dialister sp.]|jgi:Flp pilus assembly pilin Flp|uniref:Flp family type IVb pilin n=1 Tax=uncultured Dialister sp. TaxID=278064 RepID=UPI002606E69B|nr:hypothetical protein [uncultured Dialister sp.]
MKKQKGQDLIEYALMLALVVGIGGFIYTQGYGANISGVFNNAGNLLEQVDKSQEEAKEEAARNADRSYADYLGELLKKAVANGTIRLSNGSSVYLLVQNEQNSRYNGMYMNGARTGGKVWIKGQEYEKAGFDTMLNAVGGDYSNAGVQQDGVYWYGVQIKKDSTGNGYTLSYMDSNTPSYNSDKTGFEINKANPSYKTEPWIP